MVVNNAGGGPPAFLSGTSPRFHASIITLNLIAPLFVAQRANDVMQAQAGGGCIINIASTNGMHPSPGVAAYGAAKAGLISLSESLAAEFAPKVRVNTVTAGIIGTEEIFDVHYGNDPERLARLLGQVPTGRFSSPGRRGRGVPLPRLAARGAGDGRQPPGARRRRSARTRCPNARRVAGAWSPGV